MHFTKMHGIGNDFVMVNCLGEDGPALAAEAERRAAALNDRRFGVGGDGVVLILPGRAAFRMRMFNPDGSEAEMCGSAIRCLAKYVVDRGYWPGAAEIPVETGAGLLRLQPHLGPGGKVAAARVDMGEPILRPADIPTTLGETADGPVVGQPLRLDGQTLAVTCVSMGNPHAVVFVDDVAGYPVAAIGPLVEHHPAFPRRVNTEFIQVLNDREIAFRVWERGAGETLACGTGACAAAVACVLNGRTGRRVLVHLPGGDLDIEWSEASNHVFMTGPAAEVFEGDI